MFHEVSEDAPSCRLILYIDFHSGVSFKVWAHTGAGSAGGAPHGRQMEQWSPALCFQGQTPEQDPTPSSCPLPSLRLAPAAVG